MADDPELLQEAIKKNKINWRSFNDPNGDIRDKWQAIGIPTILLLDEHGVIRFRGHANDKMLEPTLQKLLREMGSEVDLTKLDEMTQETPEETE